MRAAGKSLAFLPARWFFGLFGVCLCASCSVDCGLFCGVGGRRFVAGVGWFWLGRWRGCVGLGDGCGLLQSCVGAVRGLNGCGLLPGRLGGWAFIMPSGPFFFLRRGRGVYLGKHDSKMLAAPPPPPPPPPPHLLVYV